MAKYKTALGRSIDLDTLISKNERTRAVGNMKVNARGDSIDGLGRIVEPVTNKVNKNYSKTIGSKSSRPVKQLSDASQRNINQRPAPVAKQNAKPELTSHEKELEQEMQDDIEVENIRANEGKNNGR